MNKRIAAFCEVADTIAEWCEGAGVDLGAAREALAAARARIAAPNERTFDRAYAAWFALNHEQAQRPAPTPLSDVREAVLLVCRASVADKAEHDDVSLAAAERILLAYATNVGIALGVRDAGRLARVALDEGKRVGRAPSRFPEPGFARQAALGAVFRLARVHARFQPADVCRIAATHGAKLNGAALTRFENGHHGRDAPVEALARTVGESVDVLHARAELAHRLAQENAVRHGVTDPERWFAEVVAVDDETTARAHLHVGASAASRVARPDRVR